MDYNRIIYPERAEYLNEEKFRSYKIFLDHWNDLALKLKSNFEETILRRVSKTLVIYGDQSCGKTLLANKINQDFLITQTQQQNGSITYDASNMWHRIVSGHGKNISLVAKNTTAASLLHIENNKEWVNKAKEFCGANTNRACIVIADNCERDYFIQGLLGVSDVEFLQMGRTDAMVRAAAQRFVALCREELRGAMLVMFTNDDIFAISFEEEVNKQHKGLVEATALPLPGSRDKESVVRVNTNRLNPFSYWYCLDRAGIDEKKKVLHTIETSAGFKDVFEAVDTAISKASPSRIGRPAKKCLLTLFALADLESVNGRIDELKLGIPEHNVIPNSWVDVVSFSDNWAGQFDLGGVRQASLLESKWNLRIILVGNPFIRLLLSKQKQEEVKSIIDESLKYHGPGTRAETLEAYKADFNKLVSICGASGSSDLTSFWAAGQVRSVQYETVLREMYPSYNTTDTGFLSYRPDLVIQPYGVCNLSDSKSDSDPDINESIRRRAVACEFTATKEFSLQTVQTYLNRKLKNYVEILQEQ